MPTSAVTDRFGFAVFTVNFDAADAFLGEDDAPDGGAYIYTMAFTQCANGKDDDGDGKIDGNDLGCSSPTDNLESDDPVTLKAGKALTMPAKPKAGKLVVVGAAVIRVETGAGITVAEPSSAPRSRHEGPAGKRQGRHRASRPASSRCRRPRRARSRAGRSPSPSGQSVKVPFAFKVN